MSTAIPCKLPRELEPVHGPRKPSGFIRLGKDWDGGYLVDQAAVQAAQKLVSFGINNEWSFESAFYSQNPVPVIAFDHSVSKRVFLRNFLGHSTFDFSPIEAYRDLSALLRYPFFFSGKNKHVCAHVGYGSVPRMLSLTKALELATTPEEKIFLKIDIEQWEYRILEELISQAHRITGLVIEFHHVDLNLERIKEFIAKFPLSLIYTRANNYGHYTPHQLPLLIECTFSAYAEKLEGSFEFASIDMQNARKLPPYQLTFE